MLNGKAQWWMEGRFIWFIASALNETCTARIVRSGQKQPNRTQIKSFVLNQFAASELMGGAAFKRASPREDRLPVLQRDTRSTFRELRWPQGDIFYNNPDDLMAVIQSVPIYWANLLATQVRIMDLCGTFMLIYICKVVYRDNGHTSFLWKFLVLLSSWKTRCYLWAKNLQRKFECRWNLRRVINEILQWRAKMAHRCPLVPTNETICMKIGAHL